VPAQHRVLVPEHKQLSILRPGATEHQDSHAEYPAHQQVDDLQQHPVSQPSLRSIKVPTASVISHLSIRAAQGPHAHAQADCDDQRKNATDQAGDGLARVRRFPIPATGERDDPK
jgi:hypothetical protein